MFSDQLIVPNRSGTDQDDQSSIRTINQSLIGLIVHIIVQHIIGIYIIYVWYIYHILYIYMVHIKHQDYISS
jgi:hypothetical protein